MSDFQKQIILKIQVYNLLVVSHANFKEAIDKWIGEVAISTQKINLSSNTTIQQKKMIISYFKNSAFDSIPLWFSSKLWSKSKSHSNKHIENKDKP